MQLSNWDGSVTTSPAVITRPGTVAEVAEIVRDRDRYPGPVRAVGSRHSVAACLDADGGTIIDMTRLDQILEIRHDQVRVQAGALYIDIADALARRGLQLHVNTEIGNLTAGSAACCGTKDAAFSIGGSEEFGQVSSYVRAVTLVKADGSVVEIDDARDPDEMRFLRSSYGLGGIVVEVTFRVKPLTALAVQHRTYRVDDFLAALPVLRQQYQSLMLYILPVPRTVMVELRSYRSDRRPVRRWPWKVRNFIWATFSPASAAIVTRLPLGAAGYWLLQNSARNLQRIAPHLLSSPDTTPPAQIIRYPQRGGIRKYVFSFWAFPEARYPEILREYCDFYVDHHKRHGYRANLFTVGYRVNQDQSSHLSYSHDGPVISIDPVSTGDPGWPYFLRRFNAFASSRGGVPVLNQTPGLTGAQVARAFGPRLDDFRAVRAKEDPGGRFYSNYFRELLGDKPATSVFGCPPEDVSVTNFGGNVRITAPRLTPRTDEDVLDILDVYRDGSRRMRAVGALHSWSTVAANDVIVDLRHLRSVSVHGGAVTAGAGATIGDILAALEPHGLTLPTVGAVTRQTIAGAIATGTHGSGAASLSHHVRGLRLAAYDDTESPCIRVVTDTGNADRELRAARCNLGRLGIVLDVTLEAVRDYQVEETLAFEDSLDAAVRSGESHPLQQFVLIPYCWRYYVYRRRRLDDASADRRRPGQVTRPRADRQWLRARGYRVYKLAVLDVALHALVRTLARLGAAWLTRRLFGSILPAIARRNFTIVDESTAILTLRHDLFRHVEMEVFVPAPQVAEALDVIRQVIDVFAGLPGATSSFPGELRGELERLRGSYTHHYVIPCRRVLSDDTLLSPSGGARGEQYAIGIFNYGQPLARFEVFTELLVRCLMSRRLEVKLHWGKYIPPINREWLASVYPEIEEFAAIARRYDPRGVFGSDFTDRLLK